MFLSLLIAPYLLSSYIRAYCVSHTNDNPFNRDEESGAVMGTSPQVAICMNHESASTV
jgi:hypothetical protein